MTTGLLAAYYFPPFADVSVVRATKYSKYMLQNGWHPIVYTVDCKYYGTKVLKELPREVQELEVRRIRHLPIIRSTLLVKLFYPIYICGAAFRRKKRIDAVYFCGSPFHPFAATAIITGLFGLPSALEFRDSWSIKEGFDSQVSDSRKHSWSSPAERLFKRTLERIGIRYASKVVFATGVLQKEFEQVFPSFRSKFTTMTNGFDHGDFVDLHPEKATNSPLTIALTGKFLEYTPAAARYFLESFSNFPNLSFLYVGGECKEVARLASNRANLTQQLAAVLEDISRSVPKGPALPEVVTDGKTDILCPPNDLDAFEQAVRTLGEDAALRREMGQHAQGRNGAISHEPHGRTLPGPVRYRAPGGRPMPVTSTHADTQKTESPTTNPTRAERKTDEFAGYAYFR